MIKTQGLFVVVKSFVVVSFLKSSVAIIFYFVRQEKQI
jgi:hypothetical protein